MRNIARCLIEWPVLDGLVLDRLPGLTKHSVVQVDDRGADVVVAKKVIVVLRRDFQKGSAREFLIKLKALEKGRIRRIQLKVLSFIMDIFAASYNKVRIRF